MLTDYPAASWGGFFTSLRGPVFLSGTISCLKALHHPYIIIIHLHDSQAPLSVQERAEEEVDGLTLIKTTVLPLASFFGKSCKTTAKKNTHHTPVLVTTDIWGGNKMLPQFLQLRIKFQLDLNKFGSYTKVLV